MFCKSYGFIPLPFPSFSSVLLQQITLLISDNVNKKRISGGYVILNIKLNENLLHEDIKDTTHYNILDEFK